MSPAKKKTGSSTTTPEYWIGCSGWYYWHWKGAFYPEELPKDRWFEHYQQHFRTVELNAPFYHWPRPSTVDRWRQQAGPAFKYSVKVNRRITHLKRFNDTAELVREFYELVKPIGDQLGCVLFQLPPSFRYTPERLEQILGQLDPAYRNVIEFRHASWWTEEVFAAFRRARAIFCCVSAPRLPDDLVATAPDVYVRFHGAKQWYRHDYSPEELKDWAERLRKLRARRYWIYFNNDWQASAVRNALALQKLVGRRR